MANQLSDMIEILNIHGAGFTGNCASEMAQDWLDNGFGPDAADGWCEIGCWDASVAAQLRDTGLTPSRVDEAAKRLIEAETAEWDAIDEASAEDNDDWAPCQRDSQYTDGDPIYSVCNNDTPIEALIGAAIADAD